MDAFPLALAQVPSPNYSARERGVTIDMIVVHDCQGSGRGAANYFASAAAQVSAHLVLDENGELVYQCVPLSMKAWHAKAYNSRSIGVEMGGFAEKGFSDKELNADALIVAWLLHTYGLPNKFLRDGGVRGWTTHYRLGKLGGGHTDFTTDPKIEDAYAARVTAAYERLAQGPLPAWALHGLPAPQACCLPPPAPAGYTPKPMELKDVPNEAGSHNTSSGYPLGSISDVQWRLRKVGANPQLGVDGDWGNATRRALGTFEKSYGLLVTNDINPETFSLLLKVTG